MFGRRTFIILLFIAIGGFAISRTVLLRQRVQEKSRNWVGLLERLVLGLVVFPFFITACLLLLYIGK